MYQKVSEFDIDEVAGVAIAFREPVKKNRKFLSFPLYLDSSDEDQVDYE